MDFLLKKEVLLIDTFEVRLLKEEYIDFFKLYINLKNGKMYQKEIYKKNNTHKIISLINKAQFYCKIKNEITTKDSK